MSQLIYILGWPLLICLQMSLILSALGFHVLKREVIFIDIALAQIAAVGGIAAHVLCHVHDHAHTASTWSFGFVLIAAAFYAVVRRRVTRISLEAVIGISYAMAAGATLFLVGVAPGGHIHIHDILSGSLLWTDSHDVLICLAAFAFTALVLLVFKRPLNALSASYHQGNLQSWADIVWDFLFYALVGVVVTVAVRYAGVVVVFAYLIIPATIAVLCTGRALHQWLLSVVFAIGASIAGLLLAYYQDFSIGPAIAACMGAELVVVAALRRGLSV
jgi:zinc/manganese transport system permease protein